MWQDLYGGKRKVYAILRRNKMEINDTVQTNHITIEQRKTYFYNILHKRIK